MNEVKLQTQPENTHICGQCCVAMVLNVPTARVISLLGRGRTRYTHLRTALQRLTLYRLTLSEPTIYSRTIHTRPSARGTFILKVSSCKPSRGHFVLIHNDRVFDSCLSRSLTFRNWMRMRELKYPHTRITSWAEVRDNEPAIGLQLEDVRKSLPKLISHEHRLLPLLQSGRRVSVKSSAVKLPMRQAPKKSLVA